ncbi:MAG: hypothetical protein LBL21_03955 [Rickettsiales bacterium]|nr:hypothetical protein [Rickettsiales bacterium]
MKKTFLILFLGLLSIKNARASCPTGYVHHGDYEATNTGACSTGYKSDTEYKLSDTNGNCESGYKLVTDDSIGIETGVTDSNGAGTFSYQCTVS